MRLRLGTRTRHPLPAGLTGTGTRAADAAELAEMLLFLSQWLARDPGRLAASLEEFVGHPDYGLAQLGQDPERFVFLPGGSDGESLFGPPRR